QDTPPFEVATLLWMDQHLKGQFKFPQTPTTALTLKTDDGAPSLAITPDRARPVVAVDVFYTQHGKPDERPEDRESTMQRFWHHAQAVESGGVWTARLPLASVDAPLWVYANVQYALDEPVAGAGYYYGIYSADSFNVSSLLTMISAEQLHDAGLHPTLARAELIEDFQGDWEKEWFDYHAEEWARSTYKLRSDAWKAPEGAKLSLSVQANEANKLVVMLDDYAAEVKLTGGDAWQHVALSPDDFHNAGGDALPNWENIRKLRLSPAEHLHWPRGDDRQPRLVGGHWKGDPPKFRDLRWQVSHCFLDMPRDPAKRADYAWTPDHMHVGVRWQPFIGRPQANAYDAARPVIASDSSYVQFWASWAAMEPTPAHTDYANNPSASLAEIERAVDVCNARGLKVEFVFFHTPAWASESGRAGGFKPKDGLFAQYVRRIATHFKGRVHAYQLSHEANLQGLMEGADADFVVNEILLEGAKSVRSVYDAEPRAPVIVSTTGMSPCEGCAARAGLQGGGAQAANYFYDRMIGDAGLMQNVDALNLNVSDHSNGYGNMDGKIIPSVWAQYDLVRGKLDAADYRAKSVLSSESWIVWDDAPNARDVNGDGRKNEKDAYCKTVTILGNCLERGLNTINLPWSDNSSDWAMGLTKRRDYNGRIKRLRPEIVVPASDGGADVVTRKLALHGPDDGFAIENGGGNVFTVDDYANPSDPNHLHYYIWKWYAQISGGADEVIRHAIAGESGNDIIVDGAAFAGKERYRIASFNRTRDRFTVLVYASGADGASSATVTIPARIRAGRHYNNEFSRCDFRGEGFADGQTYYARIITKDISPDDGADVNPRYEQSSDAIVAGGALHATIHRMNKFTAVEFVRRGAGELPQGADARGL
ncbi:MAG: hypothetical protein KDA41_13820, partial [Planctomycetales bacterium]|nr:hypothetical protein [Planctomycetales bacterium]